MTRLTDKDLKQTRSHLIDLVVDRLAKDDELGAMLKAIDGILEGGRHLDATAVKSVIDFAVFNKE